MGVPRQPMGQPGAVREVVAESLREELRHADARVARRARLPRPDRPGAGAIHRAAAPRHSVKAPLLPRRRTLGAEAAELEALVPDRGGLVRPGPEMNRRI